jgi:hypothetical protein
MRANPPGRGLYHDHWPMAFCGGSLAGLRRTAPQRGGCAETGCCRHGNGGKYIQDSSRKSALPSIGDDTPPALRGVSAVAAESVPGDAAYLVRWQHRGE